VALRIPPAASIKLGWSGQDGSRVDS
jgi:hypothetical protein